MKKFQQRERDYSMIPVPHRQHQKIRFAFFYFYSRLKS
jgi:hypothetical protein